MCQIIYVHSYFFTFCQTIFQSDTSLQSHQLYMHAKPWHFLMSLGKKEKNSHCDGCEI